VRLSIKKIVALVFYCIENTFKILIEIIFCLK
jgi:hypothetical protein